MMRKGMRPNGASPARRASERAKAGPIELTKSCQREDQSTSNLGVACGVTTAS